MAPGSRPPAYVITAWINPRLRAREPHLPRALSEVTVALQREAAANEPEPEAEPESEADLSADVREPEIS